MEISCDIIRDLLPLYAEDLVSEDSRKLVDDHLCTCDPCTKQLGILTERGDAYGLPQKGHNANPNLCVR